MGADKKLIKPTQPSGVNDYLPQEMLPRQKMLDAIRTVFERFGFVPLETSCMERLEVLTGGDPYFKNEIYIARGTSEHIRSHDEHTRALRFDLTVPLARVVAANPGLPMPFKRYQMGKVFRGEKAQAGRYNEFMQCDVDTVGTSSMAADAEIVAIMYAVMQALKVPNARTRVNNRKILNGLSAFAGFSAEKNADVLRVLDRQDKVGKTKVLDLLENGDATLGIEKLLTVAEAQQVGKFLDLIAEGKEPLLDAVDALMGHIPIVREGTQELRQVITHVRNLRVPESAWTIDLSVARGLGYYTGPVFETISLDLPSIGSLFSGGRYDDLVARFSPNSYPATGASVGLDRLFTAMQQLGCITPVSTMTNVVVVPLEDTSEVNAMCEELVTEFRMAGLNAEFLFTSGTVRDRISQAVKRGAPLGVLIGSTEVQNQSLTIKDFRTKTQINVPLLGTPPWSGALQEITRMLG
ncbi:MAG: histidine--tRNA ligase [bacterium]|nr:histidine--tRNA ligase [bacterium]